MSKCLIVAGGPQSLIPRTFQREGWNFIAAADCGLDALLRASIEPDAVYGDFDSISIEAEKWVENHPQRCFRFPPEKDETDLELTVEAALKRECTEFELYGLTGGRLDHEFINLQYVSNVQQQHPQCRFHITDTTNTISFYTPGHYTLQNNPLYTYVSFVPWTEKVIGMKLDGWKYNLTTEDLYVGTTKTVSNEFISEEGSFSFHEGIIMVVRSKNSN